MMSASPFASFGPLPLSSVIAVFTTSTASVPLCRHVQVRHVAGVLAFRCHHAVFLVPWIEMTSGEVNGGSHLPTRERGRRGRRQEARSTRRRSRPASVGQCRPLCPECFSASLWRFAQPPGAPRKRGANPPVRLSWRGNDVHADLPSKLKQLLWQAIPNSTG